MNTITGMICGSFVVIAVAALATGHPIALTLTAGAITLALAVK